MLDPRDIPPHADIEAKEQYLSDFMAAMEEGLKAARSVARGDPPNVAALHGYAQALEALRIGVLHDALSFGWVEPTEEDVQNARELADLARAGGSNHDVIAAAQRAARVVTDAWELERLHSALRLLEEDGEALAPHLARILDVLDSALALFERGCRVAGFVPAASDAQQLGLLRDRTATDGARTSPERVALARRLLARLPAGGVEGELGIRILYLDR